MSWFSSEGSGENESFLTFLALNVLGNTSTALFKPLSAQDFSIDYSKQALLVIFECVEPH